MTRGWRSAIAAGLIAGCLVWPPPVGAQAASGQQPPPSTADLQKQIQALAERLQQMQKDLQEIKTLLQRPPQAAPAAPANVTLDLGNHPSIGERTAKLTLVEFSDYQ